MSDKRPVNHGHCELCTGNALLCQRLNPVNWQPETRRLCRKHRIELGFHPVDWSRGPYSGGKGPGL